MCIILDYSSRGSPSKKCVSAVDMVVKHKGADFLKPKAVMSMSWYQEHGYDIMIFLILLISLISWLMFKLCSCCLRICCGHKKTKQEWDAIQKYDVPFPNLSKYINYIALICIYHNSMKLHNKSEAIQFRDHP